MRQHIWRFNVRCADWCPQSQIQTKLSLVSLQMHPKIFFLEVWGYVMATFSFYLCRNSAPLLLPLIFVVVVADNKSNIFRAIRLFIAKLKLFAVNVTHNYSLMTLYYYSITFYDYFQCLCFGFTHVKGWQSVGPAVTTPAAQVSWRRVGSNVNIWDGAFDFIFWTCRRTFDAAAQMHEHSSAESSNNRLVMGYCAD